MGKRKRKSKSGGNPQTNNKKMRNSNYHNRQKYWIESCDALDTPSPPSGGDGDVTIILTRVNLVDNLLQESPFASPEKEEDPSSTTQVTSEKRKRDAEELAMAPIEVPLIKKKARIEQKEDHEPIPAAAPAPTTPTEKEAHPPINMSIPTEKEAQPSNNMPTPMEKEAHPSFNMTTTTEKEAHQPINTTSINMTTPTEKEAHLSINIIRCPHTAEKTKPSPNNKKFAGFIPNGDCGDGITNPFPKNVVQDKYWAQRRRFFSLFDRGICLDDEGWYSVTPEVIAHHIARKMVPKPLKTQSHHEKKGMIVLDAFCGCGGNAIAFATTPIENISLVICVDIDKQKLKMAANNASVYGIPAEKLVFVHADAMDVMHRYEQGKIGLNETSESCDPSEHKTETCHGYEIGGMDLLPTSIDAIFLSPPWGGPGYIDTPTKNGYDIATCIQLPSCNGHDPCTNGKDLLQLALKASRNNLVAYFLPRNINGVSLAEAAFQSGYIGSLEMEQNVLNGKLKTVTAYFGL